MVVANLLFVASWLVGFSQPVNQGTVSESLFYKYDQLFKADPRLISGDFYLTPLMGVSTGDPFFISPEWKKGSITLGNIIYDSLLLRYDILSNRLILYTLHLTTPVFQLALNNPAISSFTMDGRVFRRDPGDLTHREMKFSEELATGHLTLLRSRSKKLTVPGSGTATYVYEMKARMTLLINNQTEKYAGRRTLFRLLPEEKQAIRNFIRHEKLRLRMSRPENHGRLVDFCNTLLIPST